MMRAACCASGAVLFMKNQKDEDGAKGAAAGEKKDGNWAASFENPAYEANEPKDGYLDVEASK